MAQTASDRKMTPYCTEFPEGLSAGQQLKMEASLPKESASFTVNFLCGREENADSALWLSFKLGDLNVAIVNNFLDKTSGEKQIYRNVPLVKGEDFQLVFIIEKEAYKVLINGEELCQRKHSISAEKVRFLQVEGDVEVKAVTVAGEKEEGNTAKSDGADAIRPQRALKAYCCPGQQIFLPPCMPCQPCPQVVCYICFSISCCCCCRCCCHPCCC